MAQRSARSALRRRIGTWTASPRWALSSRVLAAVAGAYAWVSLFTLAVSLLLEQLGLPRAQVVLAASMASVLFYVGLILAVFHARSAGQAWRGLLFASLPFALLVLLHLPGALE